MPLIAVVIIGLPPSFQPNKSLDASEPSEEIASTFASFQHRAQLAPLGALKM
tara:strand:+ start:818 stop:973 length:156 start_codon:yes stop_codon:yes gene_type:complete